MDFEANLGYMRSHFPPPPKKKVATEINMTFLFYYVIIYCPT